MYDGAEALAADPDEHRFHIPEGPLLGGRPAEDHGHRRGAEPGAPRHRGREPAPEGRLPGRGLQQQGALPGHRARGAAPALRPAPAPATRTCRAGRARRRLRVPDRAVRRRRRQEGRRVLHAEDGRPAHRRDDPPRGGHARLRPHLRVGRHAPRGGAPPRAAGEEPAGRSTCSGRR